MTFPFCKDSALMRVRVRCKCSECSLWMSWMASDSGCFCLPGSTRMRQISRRFPPVLQNFTFITRGSAPSLPFGSLCGVQGKKCAATEFSHRYPLKKQKQVSVFPISWNLLSHFYHVQLWFLFVMKDSWPQPNSWAPLPVSRKSCVLHSCDTGNPAGGRQTCWPSIRSVSWTRFVTIWRQSVVHLKVWPTGYISMSPS